MKGRYLVVALALLASGAFAPGAAAKGDLATGTVILPPLVFGSKESDYAMSVKRYELETGKAYRLKIEGGGFKQYHLVAPEFFRNIWVRKVEAGEAPAAAPASSACRQTRAASPSTAASSGSSLISGSS